MDIQTALDEYAWADDSIEACREALYDYSAGNDTLIDIIADGIVKYAKQLKAAEMALNNAGYNNGSIARMCDELRKS